MSTIPKITVRRGKIEIVRVADFVGCTSIAALTFMAAGLVHAQTPRSANDILEEAQSQATTSHRAVWVIFHASW